MVNPSNERTINQLTTIIEALSANHSNSFSDLQSKSDEFISEHGTIINNHLEHIQQYDERRTAIKGVYDLKIANYTEKLNMYKADLQELNGIENCKKYRLTNQINFLISTIEITKHQSRVTMFKTQAVVNTYFKEFEEAMKSLRH